MNEEQSPKSDLRDEFRNLGENLKQLFSVAWESEERKRLEQDIRDGMKELGLALEGFAEDVRSSEVGENIRKEANEFGDRVRSGEVEQKVREGILDALQSLNAELQKAAERFSGMAEDQEEKDPEESA